MDIKELVERTAALRDDEISSVIDKVVVAAVAGSTFAEPLCALLKRVKEDREYIKDLRGLLQDCLGPTATAMSPVFGKVLQTVNTVPERFNVEPVDPGSTTEQATQ